MKAATETPLKSVVEPLRGIALARLSWCCLTPRVLGTIPGLIHVIHVGRLVEVEELDLVPLPVHDQHDQTYQ